MREQIAVHVEEGDVDNGTGECVGLSARRHDRTRRLGKTWLRHLVVAAGAGARRRVTSARARMKVHDEHGAVRGAHPELVRLLLLLRICKDDQYKYIVINVVE